MRLVRFGDKGAEKPGILDASGAIRDLSARVADICGDVLLPERLAELATIDPATLPRVEGQPRLGACVGGVGKLIGIGLNYSDHAAEVGRPLPASPEVFLKATSSIAGPNDPIVLPRDADCTDWEAELGVVIGMPGSYICEAAALRHVAGFCAVGDISERRHQAERGATFGKSFDSFGPLGPWLVTKDEVRDPENLAVTCEIDGRRYQDGNTRDLIFSVSKVISFVSHYFSLQPGDIIMTGTPAGVGKGQKPSPVYLRGAQKVRIAVERLGAQEHEVV